MRRKEVNRCRREWEELQPTLHDNKVAADWARRWGKPLLDEVKRLREELKLKNKKRRQVYAKLELERDDLDALIDEIETLHDEISKESATDSISQWWLNERLTKLLEPYMEDHDAGDD